jgi:hypothetical protein
MDGDSTTHPLEACPKCNFSERTSIGTFALIRVRKHTGGHFHFYETGLDGRIKWNPSIAIGPRNESGQINGKLSNSLKEFAVR